MHKQWIRRGLLSGAFITMGACGGADDVGPVEDADGLEAEDTTEATTRLTGTLLDTQERPVAHADVALVIGSVPVTEPTMTNPDGHYTLDVPTERVQQAWAAGQEVTVVFTSPTDDLAPMGTAEGDYVHLLPATLDQFIDAGELTAGNRLEMTTAFVPRQGEGFAITDELIENGGELTWITNDSQYGEDFRVTLMIEPGSIHAGDDPQEEITLTLIEQVKAPMDIPEDGFGPLWTIQPRDIVFDPPARIRVEGDRFPVLGASELAAGERTELFGASLETGWKLFGEIELTDETNGRVRLETPEGIISHGAWGHVFSNTDHDYGLLVECFSQSAALAGEGQVRVPCAVINDNAYWYQDPNNFNIWNVTNICQNPDFVPPAGVGGGYAEGFLTCDQWDFGTSTYDGNHMAYGSDAETRCRGCGGAAAPYVVAMTVGAEAGASQEIIWGGLFAFALCPEEETITDMDVLWTDHLHPRIGLSQAQGAIYPFEDADVAGSLEAEVAWRNFSKSMQVYVPDPAGCL